MTLVFPFFQLLEALFMSKIVYSILGAVSLLVIAGFGLLDGLDIDVALSVIVPVLAILCSYGLFEMKYETNESWQKASGFTYAAFGGVLGLVIGIGVFFGAKMLLIIFSLLALLVAVVLAFKGLAIVLDKVGDVLFPAKPEAVESAE